MCVNIPDFSKKSIQNTYSKKGLLQQKKPLSRSVVIFGLFLVYFCQPYVEKECHYFMNLYSKETHIYHHTEGLK